MACFTLVVPWISPPQLSEEASHVSFALSVLTFVELPFALVLFGKRAAWFLVCAPLALYWPVVSYIHIYHPEHLEIATPLSGNPTLQKLV
jgi:hypothetical protein